MADNSGILFYIQDVYYNCQFRYHENHHDVSNFFNKIPKGFITKSFVVWVYLQHISDCNFSFKSLSSGDMSLSILHFQIIGLCFFGNWKYDFLLRYLIVLFSRDLALRLYIQEFQHFHLFICDFAFVWM